MSGYLAGQGFRFTSQRDVIFKTFVEAGQHLSAEELHARVKKAHRGIGYATIYRTPKLLAEAGLAEERRFDDGFTRFEYKNTGSHHDHLICIRCGAIIEFENKRIEASSTMWQGKRGSRYKAINWSFTAFVQRASSSNASISNSSQCKTTRGETKA